MCELCKKQPCAKVAGVKIKGKSIEKVIEKLEKLLTPDNRHLAKKKNKLLRLNKNVRTYLHKL